MRYNIFTGQEIGDELVRLANMPRHMQPDLTVIARGHKPWRNLKLLPKITHITENHGRIQPAFTGKRPAGLSSGVTFTWLAYWEIRQPTDGIIIKELRVAKK